MLRVDGIAAGIYHYAVVDHALERIKLGTFEREAVAMCAGQTWVQDAAAVFLMTAVLPRSMWKYPQDHAYRVVHLDAGHVGQTFHLASVALGLAPFTTAALDHALIEQALELDGVSEVPIYAGAVGVLR